MGESMLVNLEQGFHEGIKDAPRELLGRIPSEAAARDLGLRAARAALGPAVWHHALGPMLTTAEVAELLRVTRQALAKRVVAGTLIGLPGRRQTAYPTWQFDFATGRGEIRPVVRAITGAFLQEMGRIDPYLIASWANTPQDDLHGLTVPEWMEKGGADEYVVQAATRAVVRLAE